MRANPRQRLSSRLLLAMGATLVLGIGIAGGAGECDDLAPAPGAEVVVEVPVRNPSGVAHEVLVRGRARSHGQLEPRTRARGRESSETMILGPGESAVVPLHVTLPQRSPTAMQVDIRVAAQGPGLLDLRTIGVFVLTGAPYPAAAFRPGSRPEHHHVWSLLAGAPPSHAVPEPQVLRDDASLDSFLAELSLQRPVAWSADGGEPCRLPWEADEQGTRFARPWPIDFGRETAIAVALVGPSSRVLALRDLRSRRDGGTECRFSFRTPRRGRSGLVVEGADAVLRLCVVTIARREGPIEVIIDA